MKIAIDMQSTAGKPTGFGKYTASLFEALIKVSPPDIELVPIHVIKNNLRTPSRIIWDQLGLLVAATFKNPDLLFVPAFSAPILWPGKMVVTCHDLIGRLFPENFSKPAKFYWHDLLPYGLRQAHHIVTISEHTKKDIINLLHIPETKITVIPLAPDPIFKPNTNPTELTAVKKKYSLQRRFCLAVGTIEPRKNLAFLVEAFARAERGDHDLVIVGKKGWDTDKVDRAIQKLHLATHVKILEYVSDADLVSIYQSATALLFPSLYEGFGLPILEAMACGTPVVASTASSVPEVAGDAALFADPTNTDEWVKQISTIITDQTVRDQLCKKGLARAQQFTWEKTAQQTLTIFQSILNPN